MKRLLLLLAVAFTTTCAHAQGETIIVDYPPDFQDVGYDATVADLPGPDGRITMREAVIAANNTPGPQIIHFNIPQSDWDPFYPDRAMVYSEVTPFVIEDDSLTVDGRSQTAFTGDTNPDGNEVAFYGEHPVALGSNMFSVYSDYNTFIGLDVMIRRGNGINLYAEAEHNRIVGNTISGTLYAAVHVEGSHNVVGGTGPGEGNRLSSGNAGVRVQSYLVTGGKPATNNRIVGNYLTGRVAGIQIRGEAVATIVGGPAPEERNVIAGAGYFGEHGARVGEQVLIQDSFDTVFEGNYIGTNEDGTAAVSQVAAVGVQIRNSVGTVLRDNLIAGIDPGWGVKVVASSDATTIAGNRFGTTADGTGSIPSGNHLYVSSWPSDGTPTNTTIGGTDPGDGNVIAYANSLGVFVNHGADGPLGVAILGNAIFENGGVGIDLGTSAGADGATPNDPADADEGVNRLQNHPVIVSATLVGAELTVTYRVDTAPANATYPLRVEFFKADADAEEGRRFIGSDTYTEADYQNGQPGTRTVTLTMAGLGEDDLVLGTATDEAGNTSEFGLTTPISASTTTGIEPESLPLGYALSAVYPNPFNPQAHFTLAVAEAQAVTVAVFDALGRRVAVLHDGPLAAGPAHAFALDGSDLPSGVYVVRATGEAFGAARTVTLLK